VGKEGEVVAIDEAARPGEGNDELGRAGAVAGCVWAPLGGENKGEAPCARWRRPVALLDSVNRAFPSKRLGWYSAA